MTPTPSKPDLVALAPCPFCGGEAEHQPEIGVRSPGYWIRCTKCKVQSDDRNSPEGAAAKWNTRHLASQSSSYEAGLRDMRERAKAVVENFMLAIIPDQCSTRETVNFAKESIAAAIAALPADGGEVDDETYEIGKRDGYESAIQDLDVATGGDGEFKGSTIPGGTVDVPAMKARIIGRIHDAQSYADLRASGGIFPEAYATPSTAGSVREALENADRLIGSMWSYLFNTDLIKSEAADVFDHYRGRIRALALSAPVEAPVACLNCGRPVGEHSMDTADVCNAFIGQEQPQYRCAICGFVIDTRYEATKPTIEFGMAGRAKAATPRPLPSRDQTINECADFLARSYPDNASTNAFCATLRSLLGGSAR